MPIYYVIENLPRHILTRANGLVTFHDVCQHLDAEERDHALDLPELFDARGATTDLTAGQVRSLAQRARGALQDKPLGPTAIVATDDVAFGMARMYAILTELVGARVEVFRDVESANRWLQAASG